MRIVWTKGQFHCLIIHIVKSDYLLWSYLLLTEVDLLNLGRFSIALRE